MASNPALESLDQLVGSWSTRATHPALPGVVVDGAADIEWLEGRRFIIIRAQNEHTDFPDSLSVIGFTEQDRVDNGAKTVPSDPDDGRMRMHYFDSRGVFRVYEAGIDVKLWQLWREAPGFSQRFTGRFADFGNTIAGQWQLRNDDIHWEDDLEITYQRRR